MKNEANVNDAIMVEMISLSQNNLCKRGFTLYVHGNVEKCVIPEWCPYCKKAQPEWDAVKNSIGKEVNNIELFTSKNKNLPC